MADTDTETDTAPPPAAAPAAMSPDDLQKLLHGLLAPSNTPVAKAAPVDTESNAPTSWAGILGEHLAGGPPDVVDLTKAQREAAGRRALLNWSAGMMSVGPFDTLGQGLAAGTRAAQESQYTSEGLEAQRQVSAQDRQQQQVVNQINAATAAGPLMNVQLSLARLRAMQGLPNPLAPGSTTPGVAPGTQIMPLVARDANAGTAGQQGFNPGNVMADSRLPPGAIGRIPVAGGRYVAAFPDLPTGIAANADNLAAYAQQGISTVRDAVKRWVGDPAADLTSYTADVSRALGVKPDDKIDLTDPKVQSAFILAQQPHESGRLWLTPDAVNQGVALAQTRRQQAVAPPSGGAPARAAPAGPQDIPAGNILRAPAGAPAPLQGDQPPAGGSTAQMPGSLLAGPGAPSTAQPAASMPGTQGDVTAIIGGMQGAAKDLASTQPAGTAVAGQATPAPPPQPDASVPDENLTWEQFQQRHMAQPSPDDIKRITVTTDPKALADATAEVADARKAQATAAQKYQLGLATGKVDDTATSDFNTANERLATANQNYNKLVQDAATETAKNMLAYQNKQTDTLRQLYADAQARANAVNLEHIRAGSALEQEAQKQDMERYNTQLKGFSTASGTARELLPQLEQVRGQLGNLPPPGLVSAIINAHPDSVPFFKAAGAITPEQADTVQTINGLTNYLSVVMRPQGSGALRGQEMTNFKTSLPSIMQGENGRQKALAFLLNYNDRIMKENDYAQEYYMRPNAAGQPTRNTIGLQTAMDKQLGEVVPHMSPAPGTSARDWIVNNVEIGRPYWGPEAVKDDKGRPVQNPDGKPKMRMGLQVRMN